MRIGDFIKAISESREVHDALNSKIFSPDGEMIPEVKDKLWKIVEKFKSIIKDAGADIRVLDALVVGSNASYNYGPKSDLDLHVIVDTSVSNCPANLLPVVYNAYKGAFNSNYDVSINGIPVEIYVEDLKTSTLSNGIYSLTSGWLKKPSKTSIPDVDYKDLYNEYRKEYDSVIGSASLPEVQAFLDKLYILRKTAFMSEGEYAPGNLVFKDLRAEGCLDALKKKIVDLQSEELSLK